MGKLSMKINRGLEPVGSLQYPIPGCLMVPQYSHKYCLQAIGILYRMPEPQPLGVDIPDSYTD